MKIRLVDESSDELEFDLDLDETAEEALSLQCHRIRSAGRASQFGKRLSGLLCEMLQESLDNDLQLPTAAQVDYAVAISKAIGVSLPADALRYRGSMSEFLTRFVDQYKKRRDSRQNRNGSG